MKKFDAEKFILDKMTAIFDLRRSHFYDIIFCFDHFCVLIALVEALHPSQHNSCHLRTVCWVDE